MTTVDSGVETGNDSNDSSIVPLDNLFSNQINNISTTVATTANNQSDIRENEPSTFRIEFGPVWPVGLHLPISSLCPVIESYNYTGENENSTPTCSSGPAVWPSKVLEFRLPHNSNRRTRAMEILKKKISDRKMKSFDLLRKNRRYLTWIDVQEPLHNRKMRLAAATNNTICMRKLLSIGVSPNNADKKGRTPLHIASCRGYTEIVRLLLEYGADPNQRDCIGNTPLHLATMTNYISIVTLLLKAGTDVLSLDERGYNPLHVTQMKLKMLQKCKDEDTQKVKEEVHNIVSMLLAYLQKQKDNRDKVETLSTFCSRLSLSNTSDQVQDDVKDLLANLDALSITS